MKTQTRPICSRNNPAIKEIRALRDRRERDRTGLCFIEGIRVGAEAIQLGAEIERLVVAPELLRSGFAREVVAVQARCRSPALEVTAEVFASISLKEGFQGIGAVVRQRWEPMEAVRPADELCWVALAGVQYPGNLGTVLRTGDAVGSAGVLLLGNATDPYDPTAVRASTGAVFSQRLVRTDLEGLTAWKRRWGVRIVGASPAATTDYQAVDYRPPVVLFMGSERQGLDRAQQAICDVMVKIPMVGRSDSLNLAVATSIVLCEMFNQRRALRKGTGRS